MESGEKGRGWSPPFICIIMYIDSSVSGANPDYQRDYYTSVPTISSRVPGSMSITGISGIV